MKVTLDITPDLFRDLKVKAAREGRKLKDLINALLRDGLHERPNRIPKKKRSPFPVLKGGHPAAPGKEITPERLAQILYGSGDL